MPEARGRCSIVLCVAHGWHTLEAEDACTLEQADDHHSACIFRPGLADAFSHEEITDS